MEERFHNASSDIRDGISGDAQEELRVRNVAVALHNWHCHDAECTWNYEDWHTTMDSVPGQKQKYYVKAQKMAAFFDSVADVNRMIHFLRSLNPKLAYKMVDEL